MMYLGQDAVGLAILKDGIGNDWKSETITYTNSTPIGLGDELGSWLQSVMPNTTFAIGILNWNNNFPSTTGTVYAFIWIGQINGSSYLRVLNEGFDNTSARPMTNVYLAIVPQNATFTIIYK